MIDKYTEEMNWACDCKIPIVLVISLIFTFGKLVSILDNVI